MNTRPALVVITALCCFNFVSARSPAAEPNVITQRTPDGGIQPQAVVDERGAVHLVYYKGKAGGGDLFYARMEPNAASFSESIPVNSEPGSAVAAGTIRGAQLAVGNDRRVHVAWNGTKAIPGASYVGAPMWYARLNDSGKAFEPQQNLINFAGGLDGGGSITADAKGSVRVFWHGSSSTNTSGETGRALFMASSADEGRTFTQETAVSPAGSGACGCCGMKAFNDRAGNLFALFRSASTKMDRDELLLGSRDGGKTFQRLAQSPWKIASCPMSSAAFCESPKGVFAVWETSGQIEFTRIDTASFRAGAVSSLPGSGRRKHPAIASNQRGDTLIAWTEDTGWKKGGSLSWQVFSADGQPTSAKGRVADGVPVWGLLSAVARPDGSFVIFH